MYVYVSCVTMKTPSSWHENQFALHRYFAFWTVPIRTELLILLIHLIWWQKSPPRFEGVETLKHKICYKNLLSMLHVAFGTWVKWYVPLYWPDLTWPWAWAWVEVGRVERSGPHVNHWIKKEKERWHTALFIHMLHPSVYNLFYLLWWCLARAD